MESLETQLKTEPAFDFINNEFETGRNNNFGSLALGFVQDRLGSLIEHLPQPGKIARTLGATASIAAGVMLSPNKANAEVVDQVTSESMVTEVKESKLFSPKINTDVGNFRLKAKLPSSSQGNAANIKFYKGSDQRGIVRLKREVKKCLPKNVGSNTDFSSKNPNGIKRNKFGVIRTNFIENGSRKKVNALFRKGYSYCTSFISTVGGEYYYPPKNRIKIKQNRMSYIDPYKIFDTQGKFVKRTIQNFLLWFKKSSKK